jgi:hypothetical protein
MDNTSSKNILQRLMSRIDRDDDDPDRRLDWYDEYKRRHVYPTRTEGAYWPGGIDLSELEDR